MSEQTQEYADAEDILDSVTLKIADTLFGNPETPYNKTSLAEAANVSKDALYDRWNTLVEGGLVEKANVESSVDHWILAKDTDSLLPDALYLILYTVGHQIRLSEEEEAKLGERMEDDDGEFLSIEEARDMVKSEEGDP